MEEFIKLFNNQQTKNSYETGNIYVQPYLSLVEGETTVNYDVEILSDRKNPAVWNVIKEQGWNSNPNYLTKAEAAAVTTFPDNLFEGNTDITSFNELAYFTSLTMIPHYCFCDCINLKEITLPPNVNEIGILSFGIRGTSYISKGLRSKLETIRNFGQIQYIHHAALQFAYKLNLVDEDFVNLIRGIPQSEIDPQSTNTKYNITTLRIENGVIHTVGKKLRILHFPNVTEFAGQIFFRHKYIKEVYIGNNCEHVGAYCLGQQAAYANSVVPNLTKVDIGTGVVAIGGKAFNLTPHLETVIVRATTPPSMYPVDRVYDFNLSNPTYKIYVPDQSVEAYKAAEGWSTFANRIHPLSEIEPNN